MQSHADTLVRLEGRNDPPTRCSGQSFGSNDSTPVSYSEFRARLPKQFARKPQSSAHNSEVQDQSTIHHNDNGLATGTTERTGLRTGMANDTSASNRQGKQDEASTTGDLEVVVGTSTTLAQQVPPHFLEYMKRNQIETVPRNLGCRFSEEGMTDPGWAESQSLQFRTASRGIWIGSGNTDKTATVYVDLNIHPELLEHSTHETGTIHASEVAFRGSSLLDCEAEDAPADVLVLSAGESLPETTLNTVLPLETAAEPTNTPKANVARGAKKEGRLLKTIGKAFVKGTLRMVPHHF